MMVIQIPTPGSISRFLAQRKLNKRRRIIGEGFMEFHYMTVTFKGRSMLAHMIVDENNGLNPALRRMYAVALQTADIGEYARWN